MVNLEKEMATHASILAWRIPWTQKPCGLQSIGPQKSQTWLSEKAHTQIKSDCERRRTFFIFWSIVDFQCCVLYSKVNQLYIYIYPLFFRFFSSIGHYRLFSTVIYYVLVSYVFYIQYCVCVNSSLSICPSPTFPSCKSCLFSTSVTISVL